MPLKRNSHRLLRLALLLLPAILLSQDSNLAFIGVEHTDVTNVAWAVALSRLDAARRDGLKADLVSYEPSAGTLFEPPAGGKERSLGFITRAVDCYGDPGGLAKTDADGLARHGHRLFSEEYFNALVKRCDKNWFLSMLAIQRNESHFQEGASSHYLDQHEHALDPSVPWPEAIAHEMLAQHYLQDFMAPGHLVSDREDSLGTVSGDVHDQYNASGLPVTLDLSFWGGQNFDDPMIQTALQRTTGICLTSEDLWKAVAAPSVHVFGDAELRCRHRNAAVLVLVAAQSILEVLHRLDENHDAGMALCYGARRTVGGTRECRTTKDSSHPLKRESAKVKTLPLRAQIISNYQGDVRKPGNRGARLCPADVTPILNVQDELPDGGACWPRYERTKVFSFMPDWVYAGDLQGHSYSLTYFPQWERSSSFGHDVDPNENYARYPDNALRVPPVSLGYGPEYSTWDFHESYSVHGGGWWRFGRVRSVDFTLQPQVELSYLKSDRESAWRHGFGVKLGAGITVVSLEGGVSKEAVYRSPTRLDSATVYSLGIRIAFTPRWFKHLDTHGAESPCPER